MKKLNKQFPSLVAISAVLLLFLFSSSVLAQTTVVKTNSITEVTVNKYALKNLLASIKSDNPGVKRSAIYLTGKYRIAEAENTLMEQLKYEKDPGMRILIALVLYEMGSEKGLLEIKKLSETDKNQRVRNIAAQLYNEYFINDPQSLVTDPKSLITFSE